MVKFYSYSRNLLRVGFIFALLLPSCSALKDQSWSFPKFGFGAKTSGANTAQVIRKTQILGDDVLIEAPEDYCIDQESLINTAQFAFVPMAACKAVTRDFTSKAPAKPAVIHLTVMPRDDTSDFAWPDSAKKFSDKTRSLMTWSGNAKDLRILSSEKRKDILFVEVDENSTKRPSKLASKSYRALFVGKGFVGTMAIMGDKKSMASKEDAYKFMSEMLDTILKPSLLKRIIATNHADFVADRQNINYLLATTTDYWPTRTGEQIG